MATSYCSATLAEMRPRSLTVMPWSFAHARMPELRSRLDTVRPTPPRAVIIYLLVFTFTRVLGREARNWPTSGYLPSGGQRASLVSCGNDCWFSCGSECYSPLAPMVRCESE